MVSDDRSIEAGRGHSMTSTPITLTRTRAQLCANVDTLARNVHHVSWSQGSLCRTRDSLGASAESMSGRVNSSGSVCRAPPPFTLKLPPG
jgi:hypothetical protein